ncbi:MAG TPA: recombination regulator RecX [Bacillales bacterium]|nr:recombination regulator RecX [Bacillales bacterium]
MATVTRITKQKKHQDRYNVYLDRGSGEEFGFGVSEDVLVSFALSKGKEIDETELAGIIFEDEIKKAFNLAVNYLSYRMRSVKEIQDYLRKKDFGPEVIEKVLPRLEHYRYIDDAEFAKMFVRSRKQNSSKGPSAIRQELFQKGVAEHDIANALEGFTPEEQIEKATAFAEKQAKHHKKKSNADVKRTIAGTLAGKGFSREVIDAALEQAEFAKDEDDEWNALVTQAEKAARKYRRKYEGWEYEQRMKQHLYQKGFPFSMIEAYLSEQN